MYPPIFIRPRPTTILNTIDYFIMDLGEYGEYVCTEPQVNNDYYIGLVRLVCNGDTGILDRLGTLDRYQGLLITYYLLYHRRDVKLAGAVLDRTVIARGDRDEECVYGILKHGVEGLLTKEWLVDHSCGGWRSWGEWVRNLVLAHVDGANATKYLGQVIEWVLTDLRMSIPKDEEFIRHYRIDPYRELLDSVLPIHAFVYGTAERLLRALPCRY
jgi:hypothetical protein